MVEQMSNVSPDFHGEGAATSLPSIPVAGDLIVVCKAKTRDNRAHTEAIICGRILHLRANNSFGRPSHRDMAWLIASIVGANGMVYSPMSDLAQIAPNQGLRRRRMQARHRQLPNQNREILQKRSAPPCATTPKKRTGMRYYPPRSAPPCDFTRRKATRRNPQ